MRIILCLQNLGFFLENFTYYEHFYVAEVSVAWIPTLSSISAAHSIMQKWCSVVVCDPLMLSALWSLQDLEQKCLAFEEYVLA